MDKPKRTKPAGIELKPFRFSQEDIERLEHINITDETLISELEEAVEVGIGFKELDENEPKKGAVKAELIALEKAISDMVDALNLNHTTRQLLKNQLHKFKPGDSPGKVRFDSTELDFLETLPEKLQCLKERVKSAKDFPTPQGADHTPGRPDLAYCVAMVLENNGIKLAKSRRGTFYQCLKICLKLVWNTEHYEHDFIRVVNRAIDKRNEHRQTLKVLGFLKDQDA
jgi:hypothetical protein